MERMKKINKQTNRYGPMSFELLSVCNISWAVIVAHKITTDKCLNARKRNPERKKTEREREKLKNRRKTQQQ